MYLYVSQESPGSHSGKHEVNSASNSISLKGPMKIEGVLKKFFGVLKQGNGNLSDHFSDDLKEL